MKKKKSKKSITNDPNQLSFEFLYKERSIDLHVPKSASTVFHTNFTNSKRLSIRLADS